MGLPVEQGQASPPSGSSGIRRECLAGARKALKGAERAQLLRMLANDEIQDPAGDIDDLFEALPFKSLL